MRDDNNPRHLNEQRDFLRWLESINFQLIFFVLLVQIITTSVRGNLFQKYDQKVEIYVKGLHEDGVDLGEVGGFGLVADGLDKGSEAEVFNGSEGAFGAAGDEVEGLLGEGGVWEANAVKLGEDEIFEKIGSFPKGLR